MYKAGLRPPLYLKISTESTIRETNFQTLKYPSNGHNTMKRNLTFPAILLALALAGLLIVSGCTGTSDQTQTPAATSLPTAEETPMPMHTPPDTVPVSAPATTFSGTGNDSIATELPAGVYTVTVTQATAKMTQLAVETETTGIYVQGRYNDTVAASAETTKGWVWSYAIQTDEKPTLTVNATGDWVADFAFPQQINGIPPQTFHGIGNAATPFFQINQGNISFKIDATNNTAVEVHLMNYEGDPIMDATNVYEEPLSFHRGEYHDTVVVPFTVSDNYLINVICDGDWSVTVTDDYDRTPFSDA